VLASSPEDAVAAADRIGRPVAMKLVSRDVLHKSDAGGVLLGVEGATACREAYESIFSAVRLAHPDAAIDGVLVSPMAEAGVELIVGARVDPTFGPVVMVGLGGVFVEILRDVALRLAPVDHATALAMLDELAGADLLRGARGRPPVDRDAVADCVVAVSRFAAQHGADLREVEVNPLIAYPAGRGVVALDAALVGGNEERTA
jgi:acyl-CoA synthetase (NDP forming)